MKKFFGFLTASIVAATLAGCGGSKQVAQNSQWGAPRELKQEVDECIVYATQKPGVRTWGDGTSASVSRAASYAENQARARFARALSSSIKTATEDNGQKYEKDAFNGTSGSQRADEDQKLNDYAQTIANGIIKNMAMVKTTQYMRADGAYHIYVCLEYTGSMGDLANEISRQLKQQISDDERLKMDYDFEKFRKRVEEELAKQRLD